MYILTFFTLFILAKYAFKRNIYYRVKLNGIQINKRLINKETFFKILIPSLLIFLLLVLRHDYVGSDTQNYHYLFNNLSNNYLFDALKSCKDILDVLNKELGFYFIYTIFRMFGLSFRWVLALHAFLYVLAISLLIKRYSKDYILSYILFFLFGFFIFATTMRQSFALTFTIFAFIAAKERRIFLYLLWCAIAISFHFSAIIFLPVYFFINGIPSKQKIYLGIVLSLGLYFFRGVIVSSVLKFLENEGYQENWVTGISTLIILIPLYLLPLLSKNEKIKNNVTWNMIAACIILFPLTQYNPFFSRMIMYFQIYYIIYIPYIIKTIPIPYNKIVTIAIILFGSTNFFILKNISGVRQLPYVFYFQEYPDYIDTSGLFPLEEN